MSQDSIIFFSGSKLQVTHLKLKYRRAQFITENGGSKINDSLISKINYIKYANGSIEYMNEPKKNPKELSISLGLGYSEIQMAISGDLTGNYWPKIYSESPVFAGNIEYSISNFSSVELAGAYQQLTIQPVEGDNSVAEVEFLSRLNFLARYKKKFLVTHLSKYTSLSIYGGFGAGLSIWNDAVLSKQDTSQRYYLSIPYHSGDPAQYNYGISNTALAYVTRLSVEAFIGMRYYFCYNFGVHMECGIGTPYLADIGLTFRIRSRKDKAK